MPLYQLVSIVGSVQLLAAYAGLQTGLVKAESYFYQIANLLGAACLTYSVIKPFNSGVFLTESVWTVFSIVGLYKLTRGARAKVGPPVPVAQAAGPMDPDAQTDDGRR